MSVSFAISSQRPKCANLAQAGTNAYETVGNLPVKIGNSATLTKHHYINIFQCEKEASDIFLECLINCSGDPVDCYHCEENFNEFLKTCPCAPECPSKYEFLIISIQKNFFRDFFPDKRPPLPFIYLMNFSKK